MSGFSIEIPNLSATKHNFDLLMDKVGIFIGKIILMLSIQKYPSVIYARIGGVNGIWTDFHSPDLADFETPDFEDFSGNLADFGRLKYFESLRDAQG